MEGQYRMRGMAEIEYQMIRERNENIDFLRLISMFFVVCVHYVGWGVFHQIQLASSIWA